MGAVAAGKIKAKDLDEDEASEYLRGSKMKKFPAVAKKRKK